MDRGVWGVHGTSGTTSANPCASYSRIRADSRSSHNENGHPPVHFRPIALGGYSYCTISVCAMEVFITVNARLTLFVELRLKMADLNLKRGALPGGVSLCWDIRNGA